MRPTIFRLALLGAVVALPAFAQPSPAPVPDRAPSAMPVTPTMPAPDRSGVTTPNQGVERSQAGGAPVAGANSFTEGQARSRMEAAGFADIGDLQKDDQGIWRGRASRGGQQVSVMLDFQGTVTAR